MPAKQTRRCAARGCKTFVPRRQLMCRDHWYTVPGEIRREVNVAYAERGSRPAAPMTPRYAAAVRSAIDAVATIEAARLAQDQQAEELDARMLPDDVSKLPREPSAPDALRFVPVADLTAEHIRAIRDGLRTGQLPIFATGGSINDEQLRADWQSLPAGGSMSFPVKFDPDVADVLEHDARQPKPECKLDVVATDERADGRIDVHFLCSACGMTKTIVYDVNECATCNRKGGTIEGEMQGDGYMTGYVEFFSPCDDCLSNGLCPGCGNNTLIAGVFEAAMDDISTFCCPVCGWQFERDRFDYEPEPDYDDWTPDGYNNAYQAPIRDDRETEQ